MTKDELKSAIDLLISANINREVIEGFDFVTLHFGIFRLGKRVDGSETMQSIYDYFYDAIEGKINHEGLIPSIEQGWSDYHSEAGKLIRESMIESSDQ